MNRANITIPAEAISAIQRGEKIEAIKFIREATGLGLKEAKDIVDGYDGNAVISIQQPKVLIMPPNAHLALERGNKIEAIKFVREHNKSGLKEANDFVEEFLKNNPILHQQYEAIVSEKNRSSIKLLVFIIFAGALVYLILSGKI